MDFKKRSEEFQAKVDKLQQEYGIALYAAQVILNDGELVLLIKMRDLKPDVEKKYDNNAEAGDIIN